MLSLGQSLVTRLKIYKTIIIPTIESIPYNLEEYPSTLPPLQCVAIVSGKYGQANAQAKQVITINKIAKDVFHFPLPLIRKRKHQVNKS